VTRDEHRSIIALIDEAVHSDNAAAPMDFEADAIIRALFVRNPEAAYRVTMLAMAQRDALAAVKADLAIATAETEKHWLLRLLKKPMRTSRVPRREPDLSFITQTSVAGD
jgi:hypothetical protein